MKKTIKGINTAGQARTEVRLHPAPAAPSAASRGVLNPSFPHSLDHVRASTDAISFRSSIKQLRIAAVMLAIIFSVTACPDPASGGDSGGGGGNTPGGYRDFTAYSIEDMAVWLDTQPANTRCNIKLNVNSLGGDRYTTGSVGNALYTNRNKYVNLDLSGSTITSIGGALLMGCTRLTGVTIPSTVTSIGEGAFSYCVSLTSVTFAPTSKVTSIGDGAFQSCSSLTSVTIPAGVTSIGIDVFRDCTSLTAIHVDDANTAYSSQDGVLYNKAKTTLIQYPAGKTGAFAIPNGVTSIGHGTFWDCTGLTSVTIPSTVTSIGDGAFWCCTGLTNVTIPSTVTSIGYMAFVGCSSLTSVTFATGSNITNVNFENQAFPEGSGGPGDTLKTAYSTGRAGTYTRAANGNIWTKS